MISHEYKCIFIHIPKCAGTSIETALGHLDDYAGRGGQDHRSLRTIEKPFMAPKTFTSMENTLEIMRRFKYRYVSTMENPRNKYTVTQDQYRSYYKFTFIRNPWARAFSWYRNVMRDETHRQDHGVTDQLPFNEFLQLHAGKGMLKSQLYWIKDFSGSIPLDYIGRFERLSEDFQEICRQMNITNAALPHKIKGASVDYREHYDEVSKTIIMKTYADEIEMFNYSFDS